MFSFVAYLFSLLLVASPVFAVELDAPDISPESSPTETPLDRSIRLNNPLNGGVDRSSTLQAPVTDPNFNAMRDNDPDSGKAKFYVVGLLVIASIVPLIVYLVLNR